MNHSNSVCSSNRPATQFSKTMTTWALCTWKTARGTLSPKNKSVKGALRSWLKMPGRHVSKPQGTRSMPARTCPTWLEYTGRKPFQREKTSSESPGDARAMPEKRCEEVANMNMPRCTPTSQQLRVDTNHAKRVFTSTMLRELSLASR